MANVQHSRESFEGEARRTVSPAHRVPSAHSPNLDFLRAVAVLLVYFFHLLITTNTRLPDYFGQFGVLLFFVHTSLVLMFSLERIERNKQELFITFYIRRLFRIYPLSIVCVSIIVLFHLPRAPWWPWSSPDLSTILANIFLYTEFMYKPVVSSVLWSLPYEVAMYLVLPVLYLIGKAYGVRGILALWSLAVVAGIAQPHISGRLEVFQYAPCFIAGVAAYFLGYGIRRHQLPFIGWPLTLVAAAGVLVYGTSREYGLEARWILCLMIGLSAPFFAELRWPALNRVFALISRYSFGVYLTHLHAQWAALVLLKDYPAMVRYAALISLSVGLPIALYHLIEAPMVKVGIRLTEHLSERRSQQSNSTSVVMPVPVPQVPTGQLVTQPPVKQRIGHSSDNRRGQTAAVSSSAH